MGGGWDNYWFVGVVVLMALSYLGRSFCGRADRCATEPCPHKRRFGPMEEMAAAAWWGGQGAPVMYDNMLDCPDFKERDDV